MISNASWQLSISTGNGMVNEVSGWLGDVGEGKCGWSVCRVLTMGSIEE